MVKSKNILPVEVIASRIYLIRNQKVMLDRDLAQLYGTTTGNLNKAVSRNIERFPDDFMFQLQKEEFGNLIFHFGTSRWGGTRKLPRAFTELGVAMLSSVLKTKRAIAVNIQIMRAFSRLKQLALTHSELLRKVENLERKFDDHDEKIVLIFETLKKLLTPPPDEPKRRIGFV